MDFAWIDLIEQRHQHKGVEDDGEMLGGRCAVRSVPGILLLQPGDEPFRCKTKYSDVSKNLISLGFKWKINNNTFSILI